jgi:hypothetical protein
MVGSDGTVHVFAMGTTGNLYERHLPKGGSWSSHWTDLGGDWQWGVAAVAQPSGMVRVYAVGTTGQLYEGRLSGSSWTGWYSLGGSQLRGTPAAVVTQSGVVRVFVRSASGPVWEASLPPGGSWSWTDLNGIWQYDPSAVPLSDGSVLAFATGTIGHLYAKQVRADGSLSTWTDLGFGGVTGTPAAVVDHTGTVHVYTRLKTGGLQEEHLPPGGRWAAYNMSGTWHYDASAVVDHRGMLRVYAVGTTGQLYENHKGSGGWSGWFDMGGP